MSYKLSIITSVNCDTYISHTFTDVRTKFVSHTSENSIMKNQAYPVYFKEELERYHAHESDSSYKYIIFETKEDAIEFVLKWS